MTAAYAVLSMTILIAAGSFCYALILLFDDKEDDQ